MTWLFASPNLVRTATVLTGPDRHGVQLSPCSRVRLNTLPGDKRRAERTQLKDISTGDAVVVAGAPEANPRAQAFSNRVGRAVRESATFLEGV